jgi:hypothetical protein
MPSQLQVRYYLPSDYEELVRWSNAAGIPSPPPGTFLEGSTHVIEDSTGLPVATLTWYPQLTMEFALLEGLLSNPDVPKDLRRQAVAQLGTHVEKVVKSCGYARLLCLAPNDRLARRYQELGYTVTLGGCFTLVKKL